MGKFDLCSYLAFIVNIEPDIHFIYECTCQQLVLIFDVRV